MASVTNSQRLENEYRCETANWTTVDVEILGRKRPEQFKTAAAEIGFCFSLLASMMMCASYPLNYQVAPA